MGSSSSSERIGEGNALHIPDSIMEELRLKEGDLLELTIRDGSLVGGPVFHPLKLAIRGAKFAELSPEEAETISAEEQRKHADDALKWLPKRVAPEGLPSGKDLT